MSMPPTFFIVARRAIVKCGGWFVFTGEQQAV
jgi:hypothetical protein